MSLSKEKQILTQVCFYNSVGGKIFLSTTIHEKLLKLLQEGDKSYHVGDVFTADSGEKVKIDKIDFHVLKNIEPNNQFVKLHVRGDEQEKEANPFNFSVSITVTVIK